MEPRSQEGKKGCPGRENDEGMRNNRTLRRTNEGVKPKRRAERDPVGNLAERPKEGS